MKRAVTASDIRNAAASIVDADGLRVRRVAGSGGAMRRWILPVLALSAVVAALVALTRNDRSAPSPGPEGFGESVTMSFDDRGHVVDVRAAPSPSVAAVRRPRFTPSAPANAADLDFTLPTSDPDDLASHFRPGDAEPTMTELIDALRESGVREGIAAFNPPGTSPLRAGLAVPPDFELPPGYVRHHQVTDQGVDVEPILMFAPDVQFFDEQGRPIAIPEDRIVPPELAPPGLPIRPVDLPPEDGQ